MAARVRRPEAGNVFQPKNELPYLEKVSWLPLQAPQSAKQAIPSQGTVLPATQILHV